MKLRKVHLEISESCLFQKREYTVIPATQEQQDRLKEKYGQTELHPKTLIQAIVATASMGCGFATVEDENEYVIKMQNVTNRPEFQFTINYTEQVWEAPPVEAELIKTGSKKFTGKGDVWRMMAEGELIQKSKTFQRDPLDKTPFKFTKEEIQRGDELAFGEGWRQRGVVINVIKPLGQENRYRLQIAGPKISAYHLAKAMGDTDIEKPEADFTYIELPESAVRRYEERND